MSDLYKHDFYAWAAEQSALLRDGNLSAADIEHIAEEIESMGRSERNQLTNRVAVLLIPLRVAVDSDVIWSGSRAFDSLSA